MKSLVIYDTIYGNTKIIAETVAKELGGDANIVALEDFVPDDLRDVRFLVIGSPVIAWNPTERMKDFIFSFKKHQFDGFRAAVFDTQIELFFHGDAASKIAIELARAGSIIVTDPIGFKVKGKRGPLKQGEVERAAAWARSLRILVL